METRDLIDGLRSRGLRLTAARQAICGVLASGAGEHLDAAEICRRVEKEAGLSVDPATVYRTIDVLETLGFVHHVHLGHGPGVVHLTAEQHHQHIVCADCGKVVDVPAEQVEAALAALAQQIGFASIGGSHFALVGRCEECAT
jgi:Fur family ferric uptake transcriptional regulator